MERLVKASETIRKKYGYKTTTTLPFLLEGIYACTLIHELLDVYIGIDSSRNRTPWGNIIEESLCMAWAISCFSKSPYYTPLRVDIDNLLLEYKGYNLFDNFNQGSLKGLIDAWRHNSVKDALLAFLPYDIRREILIGPPRPTQDLHWIEKAPIYIKNMVSILISDKVLYWRLLGTELLQQAIDT